MAGESIVYSASLASSRMTWLWGGITADRSFLKICQSIARGEKRISVDYRPMGPRERSLTVLSAEEEAAVGNRFAGRDFLERLLSGAGSGYRGFAPRNMLEVDAAPEEMMADIAAGADDGALAELRRKGCQ